MEEANFARIKCPVKEKDLIDNTAKGKAGKAILSTTNGQAAERCNPLLSDVRFDRHLVIHHQPYDIAGSGHVYPFFQNLLEAISTVIAHVSIKSTS